MTNHNPDPNQRIDAVWVVHSETGKQYLVDRITHKIICEYPPKEQGDDAS